MRTIRIAILSLLALLLLSVALPLAAQEEGGSTGDEVADAKTPAVVVEDVPPPEVTEPWTSRFLVPTGLVLGAVAVFVTVIQYFVRVVRTRYKVVE